MDINKYPEQKAKGLIRIDKIDKAFVAVKKKFSAEDGSEQQAISEVICFEGLNNRKAVLQNEIDIIDTIIADCEALD